MNDGVKNRRSIGGHHAANSQTDSWITPRYIIEALTKERPFDLDPCACMPQPWPCATKSFDVNTNGLLQLWHGRVWMNPPYGRRCATWLAKMAQHGNGTALVFARTDTAMFHAHVWPKASALLFIAGRLTFYRPDGSKPRTGHNSGGPSVLIAYGDYDAAVLRNCSIPGAYVEPRGPHA